jgi:hypothetical protein
MPELRKCLAGANILHSCLSVCSILSGHVREGMEPLASFPPPSLVSAILRRPPMPLPDLRP